MVTGAEPPSGRLRATTGYHPTAYQPSAPSEQGGTSYTEPSGARYGHTSYEPSYTPQTSAETENTQPSSPPPSYEEVMNKR